MNDSHWTEPDEQGMSGVFQVNTRKRPLVIDDDDKRRMLAEALDLQIKRHTRRPWQLWRSNKDQLKAKAQELKEEIEP